MNRLDKIDIDLHAAKRIALAGNPNVGKSVVFSKLTGIYVTVSNYPGTTVEIARGTGKIDGKKIEVIDTPGMNSLIPSSEDEKASRDLLIAERPDLVIQVADGKNLKRTLLLTFELKAMGFPLILVLNMMDEAKQRRIEIDIKRLEKILGIKVIPAAAIEGEGIKELNEAIGKFVPKDYQIKPLPENYHLDKNKQRQIAEIIAEVATKVPRPALFLERLGDLSMRPLTGVPILLFVLWLLYRFVGVYAAQIGVQFMEGTIFGRFLNPWSIKLADWLIPIPIVKSFLVGEYGIFTMALTYAFALILPILSAFFLFFSLLEDTGYLPRLSILLNRSFRFIGLSGKAVIPMVLGLGCDTMATMTTRTLETKRERILATFLLALAIPCSAQLGVILGMIGGVSSKALLIWGGTVVLVFLLVGYLAAQVVPGRSADFILEIPPLRLPKLKNIFIKTLARIEWYLIEAVPIFVIGTAALFLLNEFRILQTIEDWMSPLVVNFLGLPAKAAEAFLVGFFRRDYGAAGLYSLSKAGLLNGNQIVVSLTTITLFVPCVAQFLVMIKERGLRMTIYIVAFIFPFAFLMGGLLNFLLRYFRINL